MSPYDVYFINACQGLEYSFRRSCPFPGGLVDDSWILITAQVFEVTSGVRDRERFLFIVSERALTSAYLHRTYGGLTFAEYRGHRGRSAADFAVSLNVLFSLRCSAACLHFLRLRAITAPYL